MLRCWRGTVWSCSACADSGSVVFQRAARIAALCFNREFSSDTGSCLLGGSRWHVDGIVAVRRAVRRSAYKPVNSVARSSKRRTP